MRSQNYKCDRKNHKCDRKIINVTAKITNAIVKIRTYGLKPEILEINMGWG
ncbi:MAG: hypothetical protein RMX96_34330 [Nostoc sp. ChiSLP02]|nr:hypothetical protein [Nostoc sp. DedSLP05]MDZ8097193.1 hypothetical protein [Nostoc sp. DedSLP01]MDZ8189900.1 hypothetical protein [Nostoc sp. ChiSLP02]